VLPGGFAFAAELEKLCQVIIPQIGETRVLFPEFTPHDEKLHVAKLFELADKFLGSQVYRQLNASELFLLAAALYAHDWGMAVGSEEKEYLRGGASESGSLGSFSPLVDESERLFAFAKREGLITAGMEGFPPLADQHLRLYVRETHARRSAARVRAHFEAHVPVGEALARLCEGHWHDFNVLDDPKRFPREYEVAGMSAHLLALTLHVRLIDLFHITDDRTPYALWRFVSPRETRSKEEWNKHRAVHGISVIDFPPGRAVRVQGATEDAEVWSGLQDLRSYCNEQIRKTMMLSAGHVPPKYALNFINLQWLVTTGTLRPVNIRFEFDRTAMFRILSEDIYDGDPHVFLRELLQNAIDAIRTRRARHADEGQGMARKKDVNPAFNTTIYFNVEHRDNGDIAVTCRDFGIGMDEHVIRNYFSTAGISYYRSSDFERQHLGFEPISRFGVGILSCFMVSDVIDLKTYRHPDFGPPMAFADSTLPGADQYQARRLGIRIPGVNRQFIVTDLTEQFEIGTEVTVLVLASKVRQLRGWKAILPGMPLEGVDDPKLKRILRITEELSDVAGFVEFPIHVTETWPGVLDPQRSLILHPNADAAVERDQYEQPVEVLQLGRQYPWDKVTEPECLAAALDEMTTEQFDMRDLLPDSGYEGWVSFPTPKNEEWDFASNDRNPQLLTAGPKVHWYDRGNFGPIASEIVWRTAGQYAQLKDIPVSTLLAVYRDGIRLREIKSAALGSFDQVFPLPRICVNLPADGTAAPNLARTKITGSETWDVLIWQAFKESINERYVSEALTREPGARLFRLGWLSSVFRLGAASLLDLIPEEKRPTVWLLPGGNVEIAEGGLQQGCRVSIAPGVMVSLLQVQVISYFCVQQLPAPAFITWKGPRSFVQQFRDPRSEPVQQGFQIAALWASRSLISECLQFLEPPNGVNQLLVQTVSLGVSPTEIDEYVRLETTRGVDARKALISCPQVVAVLELAAKHPEELRLHDRACLHKVFPSVPEEMPAALPIPFAEPFDVFPATRQGDINLTHQFGREFCRALGAIGLAEYRQEITAKQVGKLVEGWRRHEIIGKELVTFYDVFADVKRIFEFVVKQSLIADFTPPPIPNETEFVPSLSRENVSGLVNMNGIYVPGKVTGACGAVLEASLRS